MSTPAMLLILLPAVAALAGVALAAVGLRGRLADDHPHCRRCGFDLFGREGAGGKCPECGADLSRPRAVRQGLRQRRGGLVAAGVLLLLPAVMVAGLAGYAAVQGVRVQAMKPLWWIAWESRSGLRATREAAMDEWILRSGLTGSRSTLTVGQTDALFDRVLELQADRSTPWDAMWGSAIESAHEGGGVSPERWQRYVRQAFEGTLTLHVEPRVAKGDAFPMSMSQSGVRRGEPGQMRIFLMADHTWGLEIGGVRDPWLTPEIATDGFMLDPLGDDRADINMGVTSRLKGPFLDLPPGRHMAVVPVTLVVSEQVMGGPRTPVVTFTKTLTADFELVEAGAKPVAP